ERSLLDLAHALAAEPDPFPDIAKRPLGAVEAIARTKDHPLAVIEAAQQRADLLNLAVIQELLVGVGRERIDEQLAQLAELSSVTTDGLVERLRNPLQREHLRDLLGREPG